MPEKKNWNKSYTVHIMRKEVSSDAAMNDFQAQGAAFNTSVRTASS
jgi:hypothetical protein